MKKLIQTGIVCVLLITFLTSCGYMGRRDTGTLAGGVLGGAAGYAVTGGSALGTGVGAVGGALIGREVSSH